MVARLDALAALDAELGRKPYSWEINALKTAHRRVPMPTVERGHCRWCERPILGKRGKYIGRPDPNRSWCRQKSEGRACYYDYQLHSDAAVQFNWLWNNRGPRCAECGAVEPKRWKNMGTIFYGIPQIPRGDMPIEAWIEALEEHRRACLAEFPSWGHACQIEWSSALEVDHVVPLWKVALMPLDCRRPFFGPDFLNLLCMGCHKAKTKEEAADRARLRALARAEEALGH